MKEFADFSTQTHPSLVGVLEKGNLPTLLESGPPGHQVVFNQAHCFKDKVDCKLESVKQNLSRTIKSRKTH